MNTAVLTGRQVSQVMKVFIVTQAGKVADVTLQSSCHAEDESVIKVSAASPFSPFVVVMDDEFLIFF
jgi:transmembrane protein 132